MNSCPVCRKILSPALSICPGCGAMMNDSVREELGGNIVRKLSTTHIPMAPNTVQSETNSDTIQPVQNSETAELFTKEISRRTDEAQLPEWRLQLRNSVQQRMNPGEKTISDANGDRTRRSRPPMTRTHEKFQDEELFVILPHPQTKATVNLDNVIQRIEKSRRHFYYVEPETEKNNITETPAAADKTMPAAARQFYSVPMTGSNQHLKPAPKTISPKQPKFREKLQLARPVQNIPSSYEKFDTNKLPSLPRGFTGAEDSEAEYTEEFAPTTEQDYFEEQIETGVISDEQIPHFMLRVKSAGFDLALGCICSIILLSPIILTGNSNWLGFAGFLTFAATCGVVMFVYLTTCLGFVGQTIGMWWFGLETIDAETNGYPTFYQAAVSSSVYLLSLLFGGLGFIPAAFNTERRMAHDLVSGTITLGILETDYSGTIPSDGESSESIEHNNPQ